MAGVVKRTIKQKIKDSVRNTGLWQGLLLPIKSRRDLKRWFAAGRPAPVPHAVKVRNILCLADLFGLDVLVETGTFEGVMIDATLAHFRQIYSIEIFEPLAIRARRRFAANAQVNILCGDSADLLPGLLEKLTEPVLFWLDGHFSGEGTGIGAEESPILAEIAHILRLRSAYADVIIVDDTTCFTCGGGYPKLDDFVESLKAQFGRTVRVADDAIFILPY